MLLWYGLERVGNGLLQRHRLPLGPGCRDRCLFESRADGVEVVLVEGSVGGLGMRTGSLP